MQTKLGLILHFILSGFVQSASLEVSLTSGNYLGVSTLNGTEKWLGIRYGTPPVGDLRFKAPVAITRPKTTLQDASTFGNACPQPPADSGAPQSEDCLFLNVRKSTSGNDRNQLFSFRCFVRKTPVRMQSCLRWFGYMWAPILCDCKCSYLNAYQGGAFASG